MIDAVEIAYYFNGVIVDHTVRIAKREEVVNQSTHRK